MRFSGGAKNGLDCSRWTRSNRHFAADLRRAWRTSALAPEELGQAATALFRRGSIPDCPAECQESQDAIEIEFRLIWHQEAECYDAKATRQARVQGKPVQQQEIRGALSCRSKLVEGQEGFVPILFLPRRDH
jgi:hypothetical protein